MRKLLSVAVVVCIAALVGLSALPGPVHRLHPTGPTGTDQVLVPAGDDDVGGH
jgi:hypothetical protein